MADIKQNPDSEESLLRIFNYYYTEGRAYDALVYLNKLIKLRPSEPDFYFARACIIERTDFSGAEADYKKALSLSPNNFPVSYNLGILYYNKAMEVKHLANGVKDELDQKALMDQYKSFMRKSIDPFKKAADNAPDNSQKIDVLQILMRVYYNLEMYMQCQEAKSTIEMLE